MKQPEIATPDGHVSEWKRLWKQQKVNNEPEVRSEKNPVHAKVLVWARERYHDTPCFVKTICLTSSSQCCRSSGLRIPCGFIKDNFRELQQKVVLQNGDGEAWKVSFRRAEKYPSWNLGWRVFSRDNNLQAGDNVLFALIATSQFRFTVFDKHGIVKKDFAPVIKNLHIPNSSKTRSTDEEEEDDDYRCLAALAIERTHSSRTSAAPVEMTVEEHSESDVKVVEESDIEEKEEKEEEELQVLNPPVEEENDKRGVYNRSSELGKYCQHVSSEILEHPCKLRPFMSIDPQAERGPAATGSNIKKTHLIEETGTFFHEIQAIGCRMDVQDQDNGGSNHGKRAETRSDDIVRNGAQRSLCRTRGKYGDMDDPPHRAGHKMALVERSRPVTRSAAVGQQNRAGQQPSQKVKRRRLELESSEAGKHTAEPEEDDQSNCDQSKFVQATDDGRLQVTKSKLDLKQETSLLSHYFRSKRKIPTRLERPGVAQAAKTYAGISER